MKVLSIKACPTPDPFIQGLLTNGIFNDVLFERHSIMVTAQVDDLVDLLYRNLWERVYLRRCDISGITKVSTNECNLFVSISEAILFINRATPPVLRNTIEESCSSVSSIITALETFLVNDADKMHNFYLSTFAEILHLNPFQTVAFDKKAQVVLRMSSLIQDEPVCCHVQYANAPMAEICNTSSRIIIKDPIRLQMTFTFTKADINWFISLYNTCQIEINALQLIGDRVLIAAHVFVNTPVSYDRISRIVSTCYSKLK